MITKTIRKQYGIAKNRGWDRTYWAVDLHGTLIVPNYRDDVLTTTYYKDAVDAMRLLSKRPDIILIMFTCSWPKEIQRYLEAFRRDGIEFDYVNNNPEVEDTGYGYYKDKPYFNVLLDDKAGFDPEAHWPEIFDLVPTLPVLCKP